MKHHPHDESFRSRPLLSAIGDSRITNVEDTLKDALGAVVLVYRANVSH